MTGPRHTLIFETLVDVIAVNTEYFTVKDRRNGLVHKAPLLDSAIGANEGDAGGYWLIMSRDAARKAEFRDA